MAFKLFVALAVAFAVVSANAEDPDSKIVGGTDATKNEFPYQLRVLIRNGNRQGMCGGSIINSQWVLTAAHCFRSTTKPADITIQAGYLNTRRKSGGEYDLKGERLIIHPSYKNNAYDFALVKVSGQFQNTAGSQPIALIEQDARPMGDAIVAGWGTTREGGSTSDMLQKVTLPILADSECTKVYGRNYDAKSMMCAGVLAGGKDTCQGDSGGPLVLNGKEVGVVSFGAGCAREDTPGVYSRVSAVRNWIDSNAK